MSVINKILDLLKQREVTQKEFADGVGISTGNVSDWKSGRSKPSIENLAKIADYLDCSVDYLLGRTENEQLKGTPPILKKYNELNTMGQIKVDSYIDGLLENPYYQSTDTSSSSEPEYVNRGRAIAYGGMAEETKLTAEQDKRLHELLRQKEKESENKK